MSCFDFCGNDWSLCKLVSSIVCRFGTSINAQDDDNMYTWKHIMASQFSTEDSSLAVACSSKSFHFSSHPNETSFCCILLQLTKLMLKYGMGLCESGHYSNPISMSWYHMVSSFSPWISHTCHKLVGHRASPILISAPLVINPCISLNWWESMFFSCFFNGS